MTSLNKLIYFVEVAETLNFSRASERLGISQPSLSAAIRHLEHFMGVPLFFRKKNGLALTPAGKRLVSHSKQLLQLWSTVKSESLASHEEVRGNISLGCHSTLGLYLLPKFLPELMSRHTALEIRLKHDLSRKILEGLIDFSTDIGIIANPIKHPDLVIQRLYQEKMTFWSSTDHSDKVHQQLAAGEMVIVCDPELIQTEWLLKCLQKSGMHYRRLVTSSSLEVIASLTAEGVGIGILPTGIALTYPTKLKAVFHQFAYWDEICLVYRAENRNIKAIQTIIHAIKSSCQKKQRLEILPP